MKDYYQSVNSFRWTGGTSKCGVCAALSSAQAIIVLFMSLRGAEALSVAKSLRRSNLR